MTQEQLMLELFDGLLGLQGQINESLLAISKLETKSFWETWSPLITIIVGIITLFWQLHRQHKSSIEAQNEKLRCDLRLQLRTDICKHIDSLNQLTVKAGNYPNALAMSMIVAEADKKFGQEPKPIPQRMPQFNEMNYLINVEAANLISTFEKYEIICPHLNLFKIALNVVMYDLREISNGYADALLKFLPFDTSDDDRIKTGFSVFSRPLPEGDRLEEIKIIGKKYSAVLDDFGSLLYDLQIEIQNLTLGHLFPENLVPSRSPIDPKCIVIKTDPESIKKLTQYFENETPWGKNKIEVENRVRQDIKNRTT